MSGCSEDDLKDTLKFLNEIFCKTVALKFERRVVGER